MIVFLADLQNSYYRYLRNSVPIGMGYVYAYIDGVFGRDVEVHQFRKFEEMHGALQSVTPDLVAFGSYSWNTLLTRKTARYVRERCPDAVIAIAGPDVSQVPAMAAVELRDTPEFDYAMPNEGEPPVRALIEALMAAGSRDALLGTAVPACLTLDPATGAAEGNVLARFEDDINAIPSPYFGGLMDRFLADPDYLPIIQTSRGCPYRCTFCVSGKDSWSKVKAFEVDRVKAEIDYLADRAVNRYLRLADENFGILRRDVEIAEYIMKKRRDTGFPTAVSIYTDKHPTDRVKAINKIMGECLPFCISFQSTTHSVLENIKRINLKDKEVEDAVAFARDNDLMLVTELIFPLPGETRESFLGAIDKLIDQRFESIAVNHMRILKGTEMDLAEDREKHGIIGKFLMSENGYTDHPDLENIEIDEAVVGNNTMPESECHEINKLILLLDFAHTRAFHKELLFLFECHGVRATDLLTRIAQSPELCPVLAAAAARYSAEARSRMFDTPEEVEAHVRASIGNSAEALDGLAQIKDVVVIDLLLADQFENTVDEVISMGTRIYEERFGAAPEALDEELAVVKRIVLSGYIPVDRRVPESYAIVSPFDLMAWIRNNFKGALSEYRLAKPKEFALRIPNLALFESIWDNDTETRGNKFRKNFLAINSANRRRVIAESTGDGVRLPDPAGLSAIAPGPVAALGGAG